MPGARSYCGDCDSGRIWNPVGSRTRSGGVVFMVCTWNSGSRSSDSGRYGKLLDERDEKESKKKTASNPEQEEERQNASVLGKNLGRSAGESSLSIPAAGVILTRTVEVKGECE